MNKKKKKTAITIVETLITLLAISIMISGPVYFVSKSFQYSKFLQDKMIATALSQEGLELITSLRNLGITSSSGETFEGLTTGSFSTAIEENCSTGVCAIDWTGDSSEPRLLPCDPSNNTCQLLVTRDDGFEVLKHAGAEASGFLRAMYIVKNSDNGYTVESRVWVNEDTAFPVDVRLKKILYAF
jgi:Tfp pilus assembly protein PilV